MMSKMILYTALGTLFCFLMTTLGSTLVFFTKKRSNDRVKSLLIGLSSGVMFAALIWSLIIPSLDNDHLPPMKSFIYTIIGLVLGGLFIGLIDFFMPESCEETSLVKKNKLLFLSMTFHNIPEGMAVGLSIAIAVLSESDVTFLGAMMLALGVGIQNFPEGSAISIPFYQQGYSKKKAFLYGMLSGIVEPLFGILAVFIAQPMLTILPLFLSFAAGTMMYVVVKELIPEAHHQGRIDLGAIGFFIGFLIMMSLDVLLQ